jgi:hypothetical protein
MRKSLSSSASAKRIVAQEMRFARCMRAVAAWYFGSVGSQAGGMRADGVQRGRVCMILTQEAIPEDPFKGELKQAHTGPCDSHLRRSSGPKQQHFI